MDPTATTLESRVAHAARRALASGALVSIPTRPTTIRDGEFTYLVRVAGQLARKAAAAAAEQTAIDQRPANSRNPFLPYDPELFVADLPPAHVCLLNKFNVVDHHVLVVTREYERQTRPLNQGDFAALAICMLDGTRFSEGLAFYNGGEAAGASQSHKHLQWVPVKPAEFPLVGAIEAAAAANLPNSADLPFAHRIERLTWEMGATPALVGQRLEAAYRRLLDVPRADDDVDLPAYNLLAARNWMMVVPRRQEHFHDVSLNALAFVGALLVKDERQWQLLREAGPSAALAAVAPRE